MVILIRYKWIDDYSLFFVELSECFHSIIAYNYDNVFDTKQKPNNERMP